MLKIKDDVDLKELEKYGYKNTYSDCFQKEIPLDLIKTLFINVSRETIFFRIETKIFTGHINTPYTQKEFGYFKTRRYLKDLIKDGLVTKID